MNCTDNKDGTCTVEYVPVEEGDYDIAIKFDDEHIPGEICWNNQIKTTKFFEQNDNRKLGDISTHIKSYHANFQKSND